MRQFLTAVRDVREYGGWMLTFIAERPAEVCGSRWEEDTDLEGHHHDRQHPDSGLRPILSWMADNGVPDVVVSAWAGHADLSFTKRIYMHPDPQSLRAGSEKLNELLG